MSRGPPPAGGRHAPLDLPAEPNILQEVLVARALVGKIIGPGGSTASLLRKEARCFLHVRKDGPAEGPTVVEISGSAAQVRRPSSASHSWLCCVRCQAA
jgi:hypothetical protein